ncbi:DUF2306 domain-containing protein [Micromonospora sp. NPDC049900]|uniref:DUF2306 domain-containing protein n=1 Tax=Micromonospora sp. NPDC049900 TaxID=3364275 RepID=UPI0037AC1F80
MSTSRFLGRHEWAIPTGLILLALVPVVAGVVRTVELSGDPTVTPGNARFVADPGPVLVHIVTASVYCLLGAFQFMPGFRRRRPGWHRVAGRLLVPTGILAALSGMWMAAFYPLMPIDGAFLIGLRLFFGGAMAGCIVLGLRAIVRRDVSRHRAWMIRGYAIGQGAGTQFLTHLPWLVAAEPPGEWTRAFLHAAGWLINLAVAEWIIRHGSATPAGPGRPSVPVPVDSGAATDADGGGPKTPLRSAGRFSPWTSRRRSPLG